jgi:putative SOS response-associated peptidase YedK
MEPTNRWSKSAQNKLAQNKLAQNKLAVCGRLTLYTSLLDWLAEFFPAYANLWPARIAALADGLPELFQARYNIAPTQPVLVVRQFPAQAEPQIEAMRWGLVPAWADSLKIAYSMINARCETIEEKPSYRPLIDQGRCILLADGYYEWKTIEGPKGKPIKETYWIHRQDYQPLALASLWTANPKIHDPAASSQPLLSTSIITTHAGPDTAAVHDRMPVVLKYPIDVQRWLSADAAWKPVSDLVGPACQGTLQTTRVSSKVNSARNQGPELIEPQGLDS